MKFAARGAFYRLLLGVVALGRITANGAGTTAMPHPEDASIFHTYLIENGLAGRWAGDAIPLTSDEIRSTYPGLRFYFTFKSPPPPPGAPLPEVIAAHERAMEEYQQHSLRITIGIDERGHVHPLRTPEDFNVGLQPVKSNEEARTAAAAILSLLGAEQASPGALSAKDVSVAHSEGGWSCHLSQKPQGIQGTVTFDAAGRCLSASKSLNYTRPVPP